MTFRGVGMDFFWDCTIGHAKLHTGHKFDNKMLGDGDASYEAKLEFQRGGEPELKPKPFCNDWGGNNTFSKVLIFVRRLDK